MEDFKEKMKRLKEQRKQTSLSNFKEAHKKQDDDEQRTKKATSQQQEGEQTWTKSRANRLNKRNRNDDQDELAAAGAFDFEAATKRQYNRLVRQLEPDMDEYNAVKERVGDDTFYLRNADQVAKSSLTLDSKEGVERMVQDVNKQIEVRSKRSRRRRFDDNADVDYINERNMKFNKKLERFYGPYTDEIKQNFERGTAL